MNITNDSPDPKAVLEHNMKALDKIAEVIQAVEDYTDSRFSIISISRDEPLQVRQHSDGMDVTIKLKVINLD